MKAEAAAEAEAMDTEELRRLSDATAVSMQQHERLQMAMEQDAAGFLT